jgi:hypothetical protein
MTHKTTDAARDPWRDSLRKSHERRAAANRARRWTLRRRTTALFASAVMVCGGGVAFAQGDGGTSTGGGGSQAETQAAQDTTVQTLSPGDTGAAVKRLQRKLGIKADGHYGRVTKRAVKRFQKRKGIKADGIAGPETLAALGVRVASASTGGGSNVEVPAVLQRIAECESGGNPRAVSPDGTYRGKYQFDQATWEEWGGTGDPIDASEAVQDRIAIKLYKARGTAPWPTCGR